jgi:hypothetical protein
VESKSKNTKRTREKPSHWCCFLSFPSFCCYPQKPKRSSLFPPALSSFYFLLLQLLPPKISPFFLSFFCCFSLLLLFFFFFPFSPAVASKNLCFFSHFSAISPPFSLFFFFLFSALHMPPACFSSRSSCCLLSSLGLCFIQDPRKFSFYLSPFTLVLFSFFVFSSIRFSSKL